MKKKRAVTLTQTILHVMRLSVLTVTIVCFSLCSLWAEGVKGQEVLDKKVSVSFKDERLAAALEKLAGKTEVQFFYADRVISPDMKVSVQLTNKKLGEVLERLLEPYQLSFTAKDNMIVIRLTEKAGEPAKKEASVTVAAVSKPMVMLITGRVTEADGHPLEGVSVQVSGTGNLTTTDENGAFSIQAKEGAVLLFSYVGYTARQVPVKSGQALHIVLLPAEAAMSDVVVTALGISRDKRTLGYSTQQVDGEQLTESPATNFINNLGGKIAGVNISTGGAVGSSSRITIRGESSLSLQNNQPLIIIDGVPIGNDATDNSNSGASTLADYGNSASEINPADIESVNVLKGPAAAALYGARAANGAIVITTKKGSSRQGMGVQFNSYYFLEEIGRLPKFQNKFGQGKNGVFEGSNFGASWSAYPNGVNDSYDESWGPRLDVGTTAAQFDSPTENGFRGADVAVNDRGDIIETPWVSQPNNIKDFFEQGQKFYNNVAFSGGNEQGSYRLSLTAMNEKGVIPNNDLNRYQVTLNSNYKLSEKLTSGIHFNYVNQTSDQRPDNGYGRNSVLYFFVWMPRQVNMNSLREYWQPGLEGTRQFQYNYGENHNNPFFLMYEDTKGQDKHRTYGNVFLNYDFSNRLSLKVRTAIDYYNDFRPMKWAVSTVKLEDGRYEERRINYSERNSDFLLTYKHDEGSSSIGYSVSAGGNVFDQSGNRGYTAAPKLLIPGVYSLGNAASALESSSYYYKKRINSLYAMANLHYKELVYLDITARNDWSSTLPSGENAYFYPSFGLNTNMRDILKLGSAFSQAQLRLSWAQVGSDAAPYKTASTYGYTAPWGTVNSLTGSSTLANANLKPEITSSYEVGTYLGFLNGRLGVDVTYYDIRSRNQIISLPLVEGSGYSSQLINAGEIKNSGVEVVLKATPVKSASSFRWDVTLNWAHNTGKVISLTDEVDKIVQAAPGDQASMQARVGERMGALWGTGYQRVEDGPLKGEVIIFSNGKPLAKTEDIYLGNANPDFTAGMYNQLSYKNITLNFLFAGQVGGKFVSRFYNKLNNAGQLETSLLGRESREAGTEYDDPYYIPGAAQMADGSYTANNTSKDGTYSAGVYGTDARSFAQRINKISEAQLFSATYFKLREVSVGYSFPQQWLKKTFIKNARLSFTGRNLLLFTPSSNKYFDPEVAVATVSNGLVAGFEEMTFPSSREMGVSLNFNF